MYGWYLNKWLDCTQPLEPSWMCKYWNECCSSGNLKTIGSCVFCFKNSNFLEFYLLFWTSRKPSGTSLQYSEPRRLQLILLINIWELKKLDNADHVPIEMLLTEACIFVCVIFRLAKNFVTKNKITQFVLGWDFLIVPILVEWQTTKNLHSLLFYTGNYLHARFQVLLLQVHWSFYIHTNLCVLWEIILVLFIHLGGWRHWFQKTGNFIGKLMQ